MNAECKDYAQAGLNNLMVRKTYGQDQIRYLRCRTCQHEFSERKGSALWNMKVSEEKAAAVAAHLAEGCSMSATWRLSGVDRSVVVRLNRRLGQHGQAFHETRVQRNQCTSVRLNCHNTEKTEAHSRVPLQPVCTKLGKADGLWLNWCPQ